MKGAGLSRRLWLGGSIGVAASLTIRPTLAQDRVHPLADADLSALESDIAGRPALGRLLSIQGDETFQRAELNYDVISFTGPGSIYFDVPANTVSVYLIARTIQFSHPEAGPFKIGFRDIDPRSLDGQSRQSPDARQTPVRPNIVLRADSFRDGAQRELTIAEIAQLPVIICGNGVSGGNGRSGEAGFAGTNGANARRGRSSHGGGPDHSDPVCVSQGSPGGNGGNGGAGSRGGNAGRGTNGSTVYLLGPHGISRAMTSWQFELAGGVAGHPGSEGLGGPGGQGGSPASGGACDDQPGGAPGRPGVTAPAGASAGDGVRGAIFFGDY